MYEVLFKQPNFTIIFSLFVSERKRKNLKTALCENKMPAFAPIPLPRYLCRSDQSQPACRSPSFPSAYYIPFRLYIIYNVRPYIIILYRYRNAFVAVVAAASSSLLAESAKRHKTAVTAAPFLSFLLRNIAVSSKFV